jgi:uncharacterized protein YkwD
MNISYTQTPKMTYTKKQKFITNIIATATFLTVSGFVFTPKLYASEINENNLVTLVNQEREANSLRPLKLRQELDLAATKKSNDMIARNYFSHYAYGRTPWDFILESNYNYLYAGENLAMNFDTSEGVVNAWMNSPAHRANILNADYDEFGFGVVTKTETVEGTEKNSIVVTNMFGREKPQILEIFDRFVSRIGSIFNLDS